MRFKKKLFGSKFVNQHVAEVYGVKKDFREYAWDDGDTLYSHITGGIILPIFEQPGFLLTIGVRHSDNAFVCFDEFESETESELVERAQEIQKEYGDGVIENWWGDPTQLMSIVNAMNQKDNPVLISQPFDWDQKDAFQLYVARIKTALIEGHKTLYLGKCNLIRNHIQAFVQARSEKQTNNPAITVIGSLVHTLLMIRPWESNFVSTRLIPTSFEDYAEYEHEQAMKEIEEELWGDVA